MAGCAGLPAAGAVSGQSGSSLPALQSSAVVRPARAWADTVSDRNAVNAKAVRSMRMAGCVPRVFRGACKIKLRWDGMCKRAAVAVASGMSKIEDMADLKMYDDEQVILQRWRHGRVDPILKVGLNGQPLIDLRAIGQLKIRLV